jgi:hypothetical protein
MNKHRERCNWDEVQKRREQERLIEERRIAYLQQEQAQCEAIRLQERLVLQSSLHFFCTGKPVPSVAERVELEKRRLKELFAETGKEELLYWKQWFWGQEEVISSRHRDPTRGPSLQEFELYKKKQEEVIHQLENTIRQLRLQQGISVYDQIEKKDENKEEKGELREETKEIAETVNKVVVHDEMKAEAVNKIDINNEEKYEEC